MFFLSAIRTVLDHFLAPQVSRLRMSRSQRLLYASVVFANGRAWRTGAAGVKRVRFLPNRVGESASVRASCFRAFVCKRRISVHCSEGENKHGPRLQVVRPLHRRVTLKTCSFGRRNRDKRWVYMRGLL